MQIIELFVRNSLEDTVHVLELDGILDMCIHACLQVYITPSVFTFCNGVIYYVLNNL